MKPYFSEKFDSLYNDYLKKYKSDDFDLSETVKEFRIILQGILDETLSRKTNKKDYANFAETINAAESIQSFFELKSKIQSQGNSIKREQIQNEKRKSDLGKNKYNPDNPYRG